VNSITKLEKCLLERLLRKDERRTKGNHSTTERVSSEKATEAKIS